MLWQAKLTIFYCIGIRLREADNLTWADIDFKVGELHVTVKEKGGYVQAWTPKDHERRTIPLPEQALNLLTALQSKASENCPYVFMDPGRWDYYRSVVDAKAWKSRQLVNNSLRRFKTLCRLAGVPELTIHDLRRSCITNWARKLPVHVVQALAGHADINTTKEFYLSIQAEDIRLAKKVQKALLGKMTPVATDPKLTHKGFRRHFKGQKVFDGLPKIPDLLGF